MKDQSLQPVHGMRDLLPPEAKQKEYVINAIKTIFERHGFEPIETPALEHWEILSCKESYGEEEKLIYKFKDKSGRDVGLRYDFSVPLSRVMAYYKDEITFPFRRYQIQQVWRGESPQYGRMREFTQCDIDIVGSSSMLADAEIISIIHEVIKFFGIKDYYIYVNNRKILEEIIEHCGISKDKKFITLRAMDKVEKIGIDGVNAKLNLGGISEDSRKKLIEIVNKCTTLEKTEAIFPNNEGVKELKEIFEYLKTFMRLERVRFNPWLVRGLDYYTGTIFETKLKRPKVGSVASGGRFDNLIGQFCAEKIPAVGVSFGVDRLMIALNDLHLLEKMPPIASVLITIIDKKCFHYAISVAKKIMKENVNVCLYPSEEKIDKQIKYADKYSIPYVVIIGEDEIKENKITIKNMKKGTQKKVKLEEISGKLFK